MNWKMGAHVLADMKMVMRDCPEKEYYVEHSLGSKKKRVEIPQATHDQ
jgi:hypothetical protein